MEIHSENTFARWTAPECPFALEYAPRVLDDIRLAVTDAFFSLPRGGAEIGGILLGRHDNGRVTIADSVAMDCEHAFGPSFVLSPRDHAKLADLVAADRDANLRPVGWYHSHTRSEIFLSDADLEIHNRFFPEPWHVALVVKPHTFQPMRAGFFFRDKTGAIHATATYREFVLDPLPMRPVPASPAAPETLAFPPARDPEPNGRIINVAARIDDPEPPPQPATQPAPDVAPPSFLTTAPPASHRWITWVATALGIALGVGGYQTRALWLPRLQPVSTATAPQRVALNTLDLGGQLQIRWDGASPAARAAAAGSLLLIDGAADPLTLPLDARHVQTGSFTYARQSDRVDVTLILPQPGGKEVREAVLFAGAPPLSAKPAEAPESAALASENAALKQDLARQTDRAARLQKALDDLRKVVQRDQQRKRLEHQSPDTVK